MNRTITQRPVPVPVPALFILCTDIFYPTEILFQILSRFFFVAKQYDCITLTPYTNREKMIPCFHQALVVSPWLIHPEVSIFRLRPWQIYAQPRFHQSSKIFFTTGLSSPRLQVFQPAYTTIASIIAKYLITSIIPIRYIIKALTILEHGYITAFAPLGLIVVGFDNGAAVTAQHASNLAIKPPVWVHFSPVPLLF